MAESKLLLAGVALLVVACGSEHVSRQSRIDRESRGACYSFVSLGNRPGVVVDLDDSGRVLVRSPGPDAAYAFVWHAGALTELPPVGAAMSVDVTDLNNAGDVVGSSGDSAVEWQAGVAHAIPTPGRRSVAHAINDAGHAVGGYEDDDGRWHAFIHRDGATSELPTPGRSVVAVGINESDDVLAYETTSDTTVRALLLRKGTVVEVGEGFDKSSLQINARGQILGNARLGDGHVHAMLWTEGVLRDLAPDRGRDVWAARLNDRGDVVGHTDETLPTFPFSTVLPFRWSAGVFTVLDSQGFLAGEALDLDERGNAVGHLFWRTGSRAALWSDGVATVLPDASGPSALHPHAVADRINESGVIAGSDAVTDDVRHPFVLIPERCPPNDAGPPEPDEPTE